MVAAAGRRPAAGPLAGGWIGYAGATALRIEAAPAFPAGGSAVRYLPDGSSYADFPGGLRYVTTRGGRRHITASVIYVGFFEGKLDGYGAGQGNEAVAWAVKARQEVEAELRNLAAET